MEDIQQSQNHLNWHQQHKQSLTFGERSADTMRNNMGSWPFVWCFLIFMVVWSVGNTIILGTKAFDPYPYILLNLFLSMLAGLQGAILLIAAKRQDAIASAMAENDYQTNLRSLEIIERLEKMNQHQMQILQKLDIETAKLDIKEDLE